MQNQQMAMAGMNASIPPDGTPIMGNMPRPMQPGQQLKEPMNDPRFELNTYIYDYFLRNKHYSLARMLLESELKPSVKREAKPSPGNRNMNGLDPMEDSKDDLPPARLPDHVVAENSFLMDWWCLFWDVWSTARKRGDNSRSVQYMAHARTLAQMQTEQRNNRISMPNAAMNSAQYSNMMRAMPNGVAPNELAKRAAMNNRNPQGNPMANMNMKNQMMAAQMQRDGSQMDMNGQRPQSPGSTENAPSPNKRARVEGAMNAGNMPGNQFGEFAPGAPNMQQKPLEGMNPAVQGSPMNTGLEGHENVFAGNQPRPGMPGGGAPGQAQGNHALQDYQMQLMLLEQQNKKRLLMARQEQDSMSAGPHGQPAVGAPGFPPAMSPQGSRAGPSPNPTTDQMKRGGVTPKLPQQGLPGSPMPDGTMPQQRSSPAPNMNFDPSQMPPGMPPQFTYTQMGQNPMMRPPSSHPGGFNPQQLTPQQMESMRQNGGMQNGNFRGPPQGMMPGQQFGPMATPQQRNQMPPPPAPAGEQPRAQEPSPQQPSQAPPTPSTANKPAPKKKVTKNDKKTAKPKGAATGATPAASNDEPPTPGAPSTPIAPVTPLHPNTFKGPNGQQPVQPPNQPQPTAAAQQPPMETGAPFGAIGDDTNLDFSMDFAASDALENFDFDSFLQVGDENSFGGLGTDFPFDPVEAGENMA